MIALTLYLLGMIYAQAFNTDRKIQGAALVINVVLWPIVAAIGVVIGVYKVVVMPWKR